MAAPTQAPPATARKVVTLVFADLTGSTSLHERMDAESVRLVMDRFYDTMRAVVTVHGGTVVKFMGDGLMAAFGTPTVAEDDAVRAVRAAAAMQEAFVALADEVRREREARVGLRVGVNTGEVVVAEGEDDVVGDAVNVAARLEHSAEASQVLVGQQTWRLTRHLFTFEELAPLVLKGKAERVPAYRLESLDAPTPEEASPFVGRDAELARLTAAFDAAVEKRRAQLVTVIGSPGLGKSRLVWELTQRLTGHAAAFEGKCEPSGASTFAPVAEVLRAMAGIDEQATAEEVVKALTAMFSEGNDDAARIAVGAASVLGVGTSVSPEETFWAVRRVIEQVAAQQPAIIVFDDVHWAEPMLLDLIDHLAEWTRDAPVLLVALARPEIRDVRAALSDVAGAPSDVVVLDALPAEEGMRLASELLHGHQLHEDVAGRLLASAEGNPLFLRELVKMLVDDRVLHLEDGVWVAAEGVVLEVPPTIHALLSARIERLGSHERSVVERASVIGHQFFRGAVAVLAPPPVASQIDSHLENLRRKEVIEPEGTYWIDEPVFRFHHGLIRDAAYRRLLKEARAELHERVADWLVTKAGDLVGDHEEVIGYHLEQAHQYRQDLGGADGTTSDLGNRAAIHLAAAARRSLDRDDLRSATGLIGRAVACLPAGDPSRAELLVDRCEALLGLGEVGAGAAALAELEVAAGGDPRFAAWAEAFHAQVASFSEPEALPDWVPRAVAAADRLEELGDAVGTAKAAAVHASLLARLGQVAACETALDRALAAAREAGDRRRANGVLAGAPLAALWGPSPVTRAAGRCLDVVRVLRITTGSPPVEAVALRAQGVLEAFRGRFDAARRLVAASRRTLEELGLRHGILQTEVFTGLVELAADEPAAAEAAFRSAYDGFRALGVGVDAAQAGALLARACLAQGRDDEALALTEDSERLGGHDLKTAIAWRAVRAEALARRDAGDEALRLAREAVDLAAPTDALIDHADARLALAAVMAAGGDAVGAEREARRAAELYDAKGATALVERTRPLVGTAAPRPGRTEQPRGAARGDDLGESNRVATVWKQYQLLFPRADVDGILATVSPDYVLEERQYHAQHTSRGREGYRDLLTAIFEGDFTDVDAEVVATRGSRLALVRVVWKVRARSGGDLEVVHLRVDEAGEDELLTRSVVFDGDALDAAFDELDRWFAGHVEPSYRPVLEASVARRRAINTHHWQGLRDLLTEDFRTVDRRITGVGELDADGLVEVLGDIVEHVASDVVFYDVEATRLAPHCVVHRSRSWGTDREGGRYDVGLYFLEVFDGRGFERLEVFDEDQRAEAVARFDELASRVEHDLHADSLALSSWKQGWQATVARDFDGILAVVADDVTYEERMRAPGVITLVGKDALKDLYAQLFSGPVEFKDVEVLATRGSRLLLTKATLCWTDKYGGSTEHHHLRLDEANEAGLIVGTVLFEPDDLDVALDELDERFCAHLDPACRPIVEVSSAIRRAYNRRDWETIRSVLAEDFVLMDHRPAGWGQLDADEYIERLRGFIPLAPDVTMLSVDAGFVSPDQVLARMTASGTDLGGGHFEVPYDLVGTFAYGKFRRMELHDPEDRDQALARLRQPKSGDSDAGPPMLATDVEAELSPAFARFEELAVEATEDGTPDNLALRAWKGARAAMGAGDVDAILANSTDEVFYEERKRSPAQFTLTGRESLGEMLSVMLARGAWRIDTDVVATRGTRLALTDNALRHVDAAGGTTEYRALRVDETDEAGKFTATVVFEPDDLDAALEELDARFRAQLAPSCRPYLDLVERMHVAYQNQDVEAYRSLFTDDFVLVDHRPAGWGTLGVDDYCTHIAGLFEVVDEILVRQVETYVTPAGGVGRTIAVATAMEGGSVEIAFHAIALTSGERFSHMEFFPDDDRSAAWARFEDLVVNKSVTTIATRGERLALVGFGAEVESPWDSEAELSRLRVDEIDDSGRVSRSVTFGADALEDAYLQLDEWFRDSLPATHRAGLDHILAGRRAYNAHDWVQIRSLFTDDFVLVDHRPGWFGTLDLDGYVERLEALLEVAPDASITVFDVPRIGAEAGVVGWSTTGTGPEGVAMEIAFYSVGVWSAGRTTRFEFFSLEDRERALLRFEDLTSG